MERQPTASPHLPPRVLAYAAASDRTPTPAPHTHSRVAPSPTVSTPRTPHRRPRRLRSARAPCRRRFRRPASASSRRAGCGSTPSSRGVVWLPHFWNVEIRQTSSLLARDSAGGWRRSRCFPAYQAIRNRSDRVGDGWRLGAHRKSSGASRGLFRCTTCGKNQYPGTAPACRRRMRSIVGARPLLG